MIWLCLLGFEGVFSPHVETVVLLSKKIIGANSVVGSDVEPYSIVVGNPARLLRRRFDEELTELLLRWKWWDKSIEEIDALIPLITGSDIESVKRTIHAYLEG